MKYALNVLCVRVNAAVDGLERTTELKAIIAKINGIINGHTSLDNIVQDLKSMVLALVACIDKQIQPAKGIQNQRFFK